MQLIYKDDWDLARARMDAWWQGDIIDRVAINITAPKERLPEESVSPGDLEDYWTNPDRVIPRLQKHIENTWWGGEAFPVMFPVSTGMVAILAPYLGCSLRFINRQTTWSDPLIRDWSHKPPLKFDRANKWWRISERLFRAAGEHAEGRYYIGGPDLNGPGEIIARLRESEGLAFDMIDHPDDVLTAMSEINRAWLDAFHAVYDTIHQYVDGYVWWMGIWSDVPAIDLQCDFSIMISQEMFNRFFLPFLEEQTEWVDRTIYHLDGPGAVRHLDALMALPRLTGIQWVPGAGAARMSGWIDLLKRIQAGGKLLFISCDPDEVEPLVRQLKPEGLLLNTHCNTVEEGEELLRRVHDLTGKE